MIINDNEYTGSAVYQIKNITNNKIYIGSSTNYKTRINTHIIDLKAGRHTNKLLQEDYNNNNDFEISILRKYKHKIKNELFSREHDYIKRAQAEGQELYNITEMKNNYYISFELLRDKMADLYAMEHFNRHIGVFNTYSPAKIEMYYKLLGAKTPEEEKQIIEEYEKAIDYQNKRQYYQYQLQLDYDDLLDLPEEERKQVIKEARSHAGGNSSWTQ